MTKYYDDNLLLIIYAFFMLKHKCLISQNNVIKTIDIPNTLDDIQNFYSSFIDICDTKLYILIKDEICNIQEQERTNNTDEQEESIFYSVCDRSLNNTSITQITDTIKLLHIEDLRSTFVEKHNLILGSIMMNMSVSAFSVFEYWVNRAYQVLGAEHQHIIQNSRDEKKLKILQKSTSLNKNNLEELRKLLKQINKIPNNFISFQDKYNGLITLIDRTKYNRDLQKDKEIIDFLSKQRNSVHNLGIHAGNNLELEWNGKKYQLISNKPTYYEWLDFLDLIGQLIDIYTELLTSLSNQENLSEVFYNQDMFYN